MQRLIFYNGDVWEPWEQEHIDKFLEFLALEGLSLPPGFRGEEVLRLLHAS
jgi:hypothetical protein